jgi:FkbM family methyltransferase
MSKTLRIKSMLVASPFEGLAKSAQWAAGLPFRSSHPELAELFLEEKRLPKILGRLLTPSSNVMDIGCHLGSFLSLAKGIATSGRHVAIEASPTKASWLTRKFSDVQVKQVAISDHVGTATFEENIKNPGFSRLQDGHATADPVSRYQVNVTTLDALAIQHHVDFLKIDIEGAELAAFRGGAAFMKANRPSIMFECGADANVGLDRHALFDHLTDAMRYDIFTFGDFLHDKGPIGFDEFRKCGLYPFRAFNFIALPREPL